jgi:hypothetical protein
MAKKESVAKAQSAKSEIKREVRSYPKITLEKCLIN